VFSIRTRTLACVRGGGGAVDATSRIRRILSQLIPPDGTQTDYLGPVMRLCVPAGGRGIPRKVCLRGPIRSMEMVTERRYEMRRPKTKMTPFTVHFPTDTL